MKFRSVFLTLCAALISVSLVSCGDGMNGNEATDTSNSSNSSADSTNRTESSDSMDNGTDSDVLPGDDAGNAQRGMNMRMQSFDEGAEEIRQ